MEQKAFDLITEKVASTLTELGFEFEKKDLEEEDGQAVEFQCEDIVYSILFRESRKRFELRKCSADDAERKWKSVSMWLFDPENDTTDEAQGIADDFAESIRGPQKSAALLTKKKRRKDDDNNVDPVFFFNRFVGTFPELKDEMAEERTTYGGIRAVSFARKHLLPKVEALCAAGAEKDAIAKCATLLNEMYVSGDVDVRAIITIVVLNGLSDGAVANIRPLFTPEMEKGYRAGHKMKGKKVKPEKKKKPSRMMTTLNDMNR